MMGEKKMFTSYIKNKDSRDTIIFGHGNHGKVKGLRKIAITVEHSISNVFLVESLGYNLLSVSQLCHMGYNCLFTNIDVSVFRRIDGSLAFKGVLGVCLVAEDPKEREHLRQILSEAAPKLSPIKLRHSDRSQDEGVNRLKDEMT
jgi:hypothetical protein